MMMLHSSFIDYCLVQSSSFLRLFWLLYFFFVRLSDDTFLAYLHLCPSYGLHVRAIIQTTRSGVELRRAPLQGDIRRIWRYDTIQTNSTTAICESRSVLLLRFMGSSWWNRPMGNCAAFLAGWFQDFIAVACAAHRTPHVIPLASRAHAVHQLLWH